MARLTSQQKIEREDRRDRVMQLARAGAGRSAIAGEIGVSEATVSRDIKARLGAKAAACRDTELLRAAEVDRLTTLQLLWWKSAQSNLGALDRVLAIIDKRVRLLGLEAPKEVKHSGQVSAEIKRQSRFERELVDLSIGELRALRKMLGREVT